MDWKKWLAQFWPPRPPRPTTTTTSTTRFPIPPYPTTTTTTRTSLPPFPPIPPPSTSPTDIDMELFQAHNAARANNNKVPFVWDDQLYEAARKHSDFMAVVGKMGHENIGDGTPWDRIQKTGYRFQTAAENVAAGQRSVNEVMAVWMKSEGHKANILGNTTEMGAAMVMSQSRVRDWTVVFATPATILVAGVSSEEIKEIDSYTIKTQDGDYQASSIHINHTNEGENG